MDQLTMRKANAMKAMPDFRRTMSSFTAVRLSHHFSSLLADSFCQTAGAGDSEEGKAYTRDIAYVHNKFEQFTVPGLSVLVRHDC
eukprot:764050-Hanusia_phi.AAC.1